MNKLMRNNILRAAAEAENFGNFISAKEYAKYLDSEESWLGDTSFVDDWKPFESGVPGVTVVSLPPLPIVDATEVSREVKNCITYLERSGFLEVRTSEEYLSPLISITNLGYDYLEEDGGLTAYNNRRTVVFEEETIRLLVEQLVQKSDLPPETKNSVKEQLKTMSSDALRQVGTKLMEKAITDPVGSMSAIGSFFGFGG